MKTVIESVSWSLDVLVEQHLIPPWLLFQSNRFHVMGQLQRCLLTTDPWNCNAVGHESATVGDNYHM